MATRRASSSAFVAWPRRPDIQQLHEGAAVIGLCRPTVRASVPQTSNVSSVQAYVHWDPPPRYISIKVSSTKRSTSPIALDDRRLERLMAKLRYLQPHAVLVFQVRSWSITIHFQSRKRSHLPQDVRSMICISPSTGGLERNMTLMRLMPCLPRLRPKSLLHAKMLRMIYNIFGVRSFMIVSP